MIERALRRLHAVALCLDLLVNEPYLLYRFRRYKCFVQRWKQIDRDALAKGADYYIPKADTVDCHASAEAWRERERQRREMNRRIANVTTRERQQAYSHEALYSLGLSQETIEDAERLHAMWLAGNSRIPITKPKKETPE